MSSIKLIVNSNALELADQRIPLNFQGTDASNVAELLVSFTNSFVIPDSDYNNAQLENAYQIFSDSMIPYKVLLCFLIVNGLDQFGPSRLVLLEHSRSGWRASFYAGTAGSTMEGSIQSLDLGIMSYTQAAFAADVLDEYPQMLNTSPIDFGFSKRQIDSEIDLQHHRPSVYARNILEAMMSVSRIQVNAHPSIDIIKRIVLPLQDLKKISSQWQGYSGKAQRATTNQSMTGGLVQNIIIFNQITQGSDPSGSGGINTTTGLFEIPYCSKVNVKVQLKILVASDVGTTRFISIWAGNVKGEQIDFTPDATGEHLVGISIDDFIMTETNFGGGSGFCEVYVEYRGTTDQIVIGSTIEVQVSDDAIGVNAPLTGGTNIIDIGKSLPDMSKSDFMKEFLMLFNGLAYFSKGILNITSFESLPIMPARDWSMKVDTESEKTVLFTSPLGRSTVFKYENNEDVTKNFAGARVTVDNQNIPQEKTYHTSKFAASDDNLLLGLDCMRVPCVEGTIRTGPGTASHSGGTGNFQIDFSEVFYLPRMGSYIRIPHLNRDFLIVEYVSGSHAIVAGPSTIPNFTNKEFEIWQVRQVRLNPRLGVVSVANASASIKYRLYNTVTTITSFKQIQFESLNWTNLLESYYRLWLGSMEKYKLVRLFVLLNEADVADFDTTHCVFIEGQGQFYCQALNKYVGEGEPTESELIAIKAPMALSKINSL